MKLSLGLNPCFHLLYFIITLMLVNSYMRIVSRKVATVIFSVVNPRGTERDRGATTAISIAMFSVVYRILA